MACASCGGGKALTPNRPSPFKGQTQSPNKIVVNRGGGGPKNHMKPNGEQQTKRTQV